LALDPDAPIAALYPPEETQLDRKALVKELNAALERDRPFFERMLQQPPRPTRSACRSASRRLCRDRPQNGPTACAPRGGCERRPESALGSLRYRLGSASGATPLPCAHPFGVAGFAAALPSTIEVVDRAGCDEAPLNPRSDADRRSLLAYCWPEQRERVERLRAALELASDR
jgi:hypothetical protein